MNNTKPTMPDGKKKKKNASNREGRIIYIEVGRGGEERRGDH